MGTYVGIAVGIVVNLIIVAVFLGAMGERVNFAHTKAGENAADIAAIQLDLKGRMNRETMELHFIAIDKNFEALNKRLDAMEQHIEKAGCEYPRCVLGQMVAAHGAPIVEVLTALEAVKPKKKE